MFLEEAQVTMSSSISEEPWLQISFRNVAARLLEYCVERACGNVLVHRYGKRLPLSTAI
jgi:hypothetical protein